MIAPAPQRREADIQVEVLRLLRARGIAAWPMNREAGVRRALGNERTTARIGGPGFADIVGVVPGVGWAASLNQLQEAIDCTCTPKWRGAEYVCANCKALASVTAAVGGRFLAIECKAPKARTAKRRALAQAAFGATVTQAGGLYLRIDPQSAQTACEQVCAAFGWRIEGQRPAGEEAG